MEVTSLYIILLLHLYTQTGLTKASVIISPDRSHFFEYEYVSLSCERSSTGWRVIGGPVGGVCGSSWGSLEGSSCIIKVAFLSHTGVYWCESDWGQRSNAVNITVTDGAVILESPVLPVMEGEAVTLRCRYQTTPSNLTTDFYKDGSLIRTEFTGEMTIPAVSKSDEGLYKCHHSDLGESPESWLSVRGSSSSSSSSSRRLLLLPLVVAGVSVSLVVLLVVALFLWRRHRSDQPQESVYSSMRKATHTAEEPVSSDPGEEIYVQMEQRADTENNEDGVSLPVPSNDISVCYSQIRTKPRGNKNTKEGAAVPSDDISACYSQIKTKPPGNKSTKGEGPYSLIQAVPEGETQRTTGQGGVGGGRTWLNDWSILGGIRL